MNAILQKELEDFIRADMIKSIEEREYREDVIALFGTDALPELVFTEPYQHITREEINRILVRKGLLKINQPNL